MTAAPPATVEAARAAYLELWRTAIALDGWCRVGHGSVAPCGWLAWLDVEAAAIKLDMLNAQASIERLRRSVAW